MAVSRGQLTGSQRFVEAHVTRAGHCRGHLRFRLFLYAMSLKYVRSIRKLKIRLFTV